MFKLKWFISIILLTGVFIFTQSMAIPVAKQIESTWQQQELVEKEKILKAFWQERIIKYTKKSVDSFKDFIINTNYPKDLEWENKIEILFQDAVNQKITFDLFFDTLKNIPLSYIRAMNHVEKLIPNEQFEDIEPNINGTDLFNIQQYIQNKNMSVSLTIGSAKDELITPEFSENLAQYPFAIHSIGKVFTGIMTLLMVRDGVISEDELHQVVQLDDVVKQKLPASVREQLQKVTLHQLMTHRAGLGDYLGAYVDAISEGKVPEIKQIDDFLPFIEDKVFPIGEERYSNAGLLLVGFAIQHAYEKKFNEKIEYNDILQKYIIQKVGMTSFSPWKPTNGRYNLNDKIAPFIVGSPGGGYWMTAEDLAKFAQWIYQKAIQDAKFKELLEKYGQEFYDADREVISHGGAIPSSSAFLSVSLKTGATIAILSDQPSGISSDMNLMIQEHLFSKKITPEYKLGF
jgi:hypothetical protein